MDKATEAQTFMYDGRRAQLREAEELARLRQQNAVLLAALAAIAPALRANAASDKNAARSKAWGVLYDMARAAIKAARGESREG